MVADTSDAVDASPGADPDSLDGASVSSDMELPADSAEAADADLVDPDATPVVSSTPLPSFDLRDNQLDELDSQPLLPSPALFADDDSPPAATVVPDPPAPRPSPGPGPSSSPSTGLLGKLKERVGFTRKREYKVNVSNARHTKSAASESVARSALSSHVTTARGSESVAHSSNVSVSESVTHFNDSTKSESVAHITVCNDSPPSESVAHLNNKNITLTTSEGVAHVPVHTDNTQNTDSTACESVAHLPINPNTGESVAHLDTSNTNTVPPASESVAHCASQGVTAGRENNSAMVLEVESQKRSHPDSDSVDSLDDECFAVPSTPPPRASKKKPAVVVSPGAARPVAVDRGGSRSRSRSPRGPPSGSHVLPSNAGYEPRPPRSSSALRGSRSK